MIEIQKRQIKLIATCVFFALEGVEKTVRENFDGVSLTRPFEWPLEKIKEWRKEGKEILFHSGQGIALPCARERLSGELAYVKDAQIKHYSLALGFTCSQTERTPYGYHLPKKGARLYNFSEFLEQTRRNILFIKESLPPDTTVTVENLDYCRGGAYECCSIWQVRQAIDQLKDLKIGLLLDFGHVQVSAYKKALSHNGAVPSYRLLEIAMDRYIEELPLESIYWTHLHKAALCTPEKDGIFDAHERFDPTEVKWLKRFPNLEFITLEYPHNIPALLKRGIELLGEYLQED